MADPALFPYALTARVGGAGVVVSGHVPNERVQWQAVRVAQQATTLNVIDELKLNPRLPMPATAWENAADLERQAAATVTQALGARANSIMVYGGPSGRVTLTGTVASTDDLLLASACLRRLPRCGSVDNRLTAAPPMWVTTAAGTLPPIVRPGYPSTGRPTAMQTDEPPLVMASAQTPADVPGPRAGAKATDGPNLPEPTPRAAPRVPPVLRKDVASATALPRPAAPKRPPPPVTLLASATRPVGEADLVMPAVVLHPAPTLAAPAGDILTSPLPVGKPAVPAADGPVLHPAEPEIPPSPPLIIGAEQLRTALEAACHGLAGDLRVQLLDDKHVAVSLRLRSMLDWDWVRARIRAVAEAAGLSVTFNVNVKP
jgi:hypothetical protein